MEALKVSLSALGALAVAGYILYLHTKLRSTRSTLDTFRARLIRKSEEAVAVRRELERIKMDLRVQQQKSRLEYERHAKHTKDYINSISAADLARKLRETVEAARADDGGDTPEPVHPTKAPGAPEGD